MGGSNYLIHQREVLSWSRNLVKEICYWEIIPKWDKRKLLFSKLTTASVLSWSLFLNNNFSGKKKWLHWNTVHAEHNTINIECGYPQSWWPGGRVWATLQAVLGHMWPMGHRLDMPGVTESIAKPRPASSKFQLSAEDKEIASCCRPHLRAGQAFCLSLLPSSFPPAWAFSSPKTF